MKWWQELTRAREVKRDLNVFNKGNKVCTTCE